MSPQQAIEQALAAVRPITKIAGFVLVISAGLKMFGIHIGLSGDTQTMALVGLGLLHV